MEEAAVLRRERQLGLRQFGDTVAVSADPRACLMYYLDCICVVIDLTTNENLPRLRYISAKDMLLLPLSLSLSLSL